MASAWTQASNVGRSVVLVAATLCLLCTNANAAPGGFGAYISQRTSSTALDRVSTTVKTAERTISADGRARPGPDIALIRPGRTLLTFDDPVTTLVVRTTRPGGLPETKIVTKIDETHWHLQLDREPVGTALLVFADNWLNVGAPVGWSAFYTARIAGEVSSLDARVTKIQAAGRSVTFSLAVKDVNRLTYRAYVEVGGKRLSSVATGTATDTGASVSLRLSAAEWRKARRHGKIVVDVATADERRLISRAMP